MLKRARSRFKGQGEKPPVCLSKQRVTKERRKKEEKGESKSKRGKKAVTVEQRKNRGLQENHFWESKDQ